MYVYVFLSIVFSSLGKQENLVEIPQVKTVATFKNLEECEKALDFSHYQLDQMMTDNRKTFTIEFRLDDDNKRYLFMKNNIVGFYQVQKCSQSKTSFNFNYR